MLNLKAWSRLAGRIVKRGLFPIVVGCSLAFQPALHADDEKAGKAAVEKVPEWSRYWYVTDTVGEIVKADGKKLVLRVTWFVPHVQGGQHHSHLDHNHHHHQPEHHHPHHKPNLSDNHRHFRNPYAPNMNRLRLATTEHHHDYELEFVPESLVRTKLLPMKLGEKGVRENCTTKELERWRAPAGVPWYASSPDALTPGTIVEVIIVRDRRIPAAKVTENDLRVKYAIILGNDPHPAKDIAAQKMNVNAKK